MVDLGLLAVAQRLLVGGAGRVGVRLDRDLEDGRVEPRRGAEGGEHDRGLEGLGGEEELDGEVFLGLCGECVSGSC